MSKNIKSMLLLSTVVLGDSLLEAQEEEFPSLCRPRPISMGAATRQISSKHQSDGCAIYPLRSPSSPRSSSRSGVAHPLGNHFLLKNTAKVVYIPTRR